MKAPIKLIALAVLPLSALATDVTGTWKADFDTQLDDVLNLNLPVLKNNRKSILDAILEWLQHEKQVRRRPVLRDRFERERARFTDGAGELQPFCQVAVWWLDQRLARMAP